MSFPQIAGYTLAIQQNGPGVFKTLPVSMFIPSKNTPIKIYTYSSGMFAVIFKVNMNNSDYAIRCFLSCREEIDVRYKCIDEHFRKIPPQDWMVGFRYLDEEFMAETKRHPVVLMDWINGIPLNRYITQHCNDKATLTNLQEKLLALSDSLTGNKIGHGDLQAANILVETVNDRLKLIDYDNLYVPSLLGRRSIELGRPEYQHPQREPADYNETIDWFSVWVMLTAIEGVKADPSLWNVSLHKGFNNLENFLFVAEDFLRPQFSPLFKRLFNINSDALQYYVKKLVSFCEGPLSAIQKPVLFHADAPKVVPDVQKAVTTEKGCFYIDSNMAATVLSARLQKIATTPCSLNSNEYNGKKLIVSYGSRTATLELVMHQTNYFVEFT